jgi:HK97 family phage portal protein
MKLVTAFGNFFTDLFNYNSEKMFFTSQSKIIGQKGAVYIDVDKPYEIFNENPSINQVINKKASMFSNMELKLTDSDNNIVDDSEFYKLFQNPNIFQSLNDFLKSYLTQKSVYGNTFIYKNKPSTIQKYPSSIQCLSPRYVQPNLTGKVFDQLSMVDVVKYYEMINYNGSSNRKFDVNEILWSRITDLDDPLVGVSPLKSLKYPITNTKLAYDYLNVISGEKGAIGILSDDNRSPMGGMPLKDEEKRNIEESYSQNYGVRDGQRKVIVTKSALKWQPMTYPTQDLLLLEQIDAYFLTIIDHFGMNVNLFSSKSQTYENVKNAIIQTYQDTIIPEADLFCQELTSFLEIEEGFKITSSYDHVNILRGSNNITGNIVQLVQSNILSPLQAQEILKNENNVTFTETNNNILDKLNELSPIVANNMINNLTINEIRSLIGLSSVENGDTVISQANTQSFIP